MSAAIGGLLLTIVIIVVCITCRKLRRHTNINLNPKTSPQPDRFSNSSSETKANTLSSLSGQEDLDGSDSLPEYHANYIKSQPDLITTSPPVGPKPRVSFSNTNNYSDRYYLITSLEQYISLQNSLCDFKLSLFQDLQLQ